MKTVVALVVGTLISLGLWMLTFQVLLKDFYIAHTTPYLHLTRYPPVYWAMVAGNFFWVSAIAYTLSKLKDGANFMNGMMTGAVLAFFISASQCCSFHASWNLFSRQALVADIIAATIIGAIVGGMMGAIMGWNKKEG